MPLLNTMYHKTLKLFYLSWIVALLGVAGSLIYSDILLVPICALCWYQRIAMYPLILIYPVGIILKDKRAAVYALPLIVVGLLLSAYLVLLQAGILPHVGFGCGILNAVSCSEITFKLLGLLTIPQQALAGFGFLLILNVLVLMGWDEV